MAVLVTRPAPDNERTAHALRGRGYDVLIAPVLVAELLAVVCDSLDAISASAVTSANALRAIAAHPMLASLRTKPLFAVGEKTASEARALQFHDVHVGGGDAAALLESVVAWEGARAGTLLYLCGEQVSRDLPAELAAKGIAVVTIETYRMVRASNWQRPIVQAIQRGEVDSVLHYSRRSAQCFVELSQVCHLADKALAVPQYCLSQSVADILREAGARSVVVAAAPNEQSLFEALDHARGRVHGS